MKMKLPTCTRRETMWDYFAESVRDAWDDLKEDSRDIRDRRKALLKSALKMEMMSLVSLILTFSWSLVFLYEVVTFVPRLIIYAVFSFVPRGGLLRRGIFSSDK